MRTTVRIDDTLLADAKKLAADTGRSLTAVIEDAFARLLAAGRPFPSVTRQPASVFKAGD